MLAVHTGLLIYSAYAHSPTLNEPGHLVAGLSHWEFGRFELYRVNPPLVRMVAALPVMAVGFEADWLGFYEGPGTRPVFGMGDGFVEANGKRSFFLFTIARLACLPFSWLGAVVCYLWGRDMYGQIAGLAACFIWCFEPNILAHASLITTDAHAAALGLAASYTFWRWLKQPNWIHAALTGVLLGLAELTKTTLVLFYPLWPVLWMLYRWRDQSLLSATKLLREVAMLAILMTISLYIVNMGYGFEGSCSRLGEFVFVSEMFTDRASNEGATNRFQDTVLAHLLVPLPKNYLRGIDIQQRDFESYARTSYLRGEWRDHGWWYYYLYAACIKVPLGIYALAFLIAVAPVQCSKSSWCDRTILLAPGVVIFGAVSAKTGFSEHFRYVLPAMPYLTIWISGAFATRHDEQLVAVQSGSARPQNTPAIRFALLAWIGASSLWIYPHSLCYFNEAIGGPLNGKEHLLGSSLDWGQDAFYVEHALSHKSRGCCALVASSVDRNAAFKLSLKNYLRAERMQSLRTANCQEVLIVARVDRNSEEFLQKFDSTVMSVQDYRYVELPERKSVYGCVNRSIAYTHEFVGKLMAVRQLSE